MRHHDGLACRHPHPHNCFGRHLAPKLIERRKRIIVDDNLVVERPITLRLSKKEGKRECVAIARAQRGRKTRCAILAGFSRINLGTPELEAVARLRRAAHVVLGRLRELEARTKLREEIVDVALVSCQDGGVVSI